MPNISVPDYYQKFSCVGQTCEDTCCSGWQVSIDRDTYHKYKQNRHKVLAPIFKIAVSKDTSTGANSKSNFGRMRLKSDGGCYFLQEDRLCSVQKHLGAEALSDTCKQYPRLFSQFGSQRESTLGISCPEAARLILLNSEPMQFVTIQPEVKAKERQPHSYKFPIKNDGDPQQIEILNDFRALIVAILQFREISLGARLMLLGFLLEDANSVVTSERFSSASELTPTLTSFANMFSHSTQFETQFAQIQPNMLRKLEVITDLIAKSLTVGASVRFKECLLYAAEGLDVDTVVEDPIESGLLTKYMHSYTAFYKPFFKDRAHIFENYLVNQVVSRLFPFTRGSYLDLYREMVFNLSIIQVLLVGIAAKHKGLTDELVIQVFQSFARKSDHSSAYLDVLVKSMHPDEHDSFVHMMWMLKDATE